MTSAYAPPNHLIYVGTFSLNNSIVAGKNQWQHQLVKRPSDIENPSAYGMAFDAGIEMQSGWRYFKYSGTIWGSEYYTQPLFPHGPKQEPIQNNYRMYYADGYANITFGDGHVDSLYPYDSPLSPVEKRHKLSNRSPESMMFWTGRRSDP
jgi:prepilin-type processing-associated H-X9-DG protein